MSNEYTSPEVIEIGKAREVILGPKPDGTEVDDPRPIFPDNDLDD